MSDSFIVEKLKHWQFAEKDVGVSSPICGLRTSLLRPFLFATLEPLTNSRRHIAPHDGHIASHDYRLEWRARLRFHLVGRGVSRRETWAR